MLKAKKPLSFNRKKGEPMFQKAAEGMKVAGPSHEEGGMEAQTPDGKPVAEIEGGERIFSQEDTSYMEREARRIVGLLQQDQQQAGQAAQALGFKVVQMIIDQEKNQREEEGNDQTQDTDEATAAMGSFDNAPDDNMDYAEQPE